MEYFLLCFTPENTEVIFALLWVISCHIVCLVCPLALLQIEASYCYAFNPNLSPVSILRTDTTMPITVLTYSSLFEKLASLKSLFPEQG